MATVGETIRDARLAQDLTVEDVAQRLKIRPAMLRHLESGAYEQLPGPFFVLSFARQCAEVLELDADAVVKATRQEVPDFEAAPLRSEDVAPSQSIRYFVGRANNRMGDAMRRNAATAGKLLLAAILIGGGSFWWYASYRTSIQSTAVAEPAPEQAAVQASEQAAPAVPLEATTSAPGSQPIASSSVPASEAGVATFDVEFRATERVWVRSVADGLTERETILQPGERQQFRAKDFAYATLGNAGGVVLLLDGVQQDPVGVSGQVKHVRITSDGWSLVPAGQF